MVLSRSWLVVAASAFALACGESADPTGGSGGAGGEEGAGGEPSAPDPLGLEACPDAPPSLDDAIELPAASWEQTDDDAVNDGGGAIVATIETGGPPTLHSRLL